MQIANGNLSCCRQYYRLLSIHTMLQDSGIKMTIQHVAKASKMGRSLNVQGDHRQYRSIVRLSCRNTSMQSSLMEAEAHTGGVIIGKGCSRSTFTGPFFTGQSVCSHKSLVSV